MICKKCGAKFEGNFCPKCGTPAEKELTVCPKCGQERGAGDRYCPKCGYDFARSDRKEGVNFGAKAAAAVKKVPKKAWAAIAAIVLVVIVIIVLVSVLSNKFRLGVVEKIEIGDSRQSVIELLGEPYDYREGSSTFTYYSNNYLKLLEKNDSFDPDDIEDWGDFEDAFNEAMELEQKLQTEEYKYIEVRFDGEGCVESVFFDASRTEETKGAAKTVKKYEALGNDNVDVEYYVKYSDGSYFLGSASASLEFEGENSYLQWRDRFGNELKTPMQADEEKGWIYDPKTQTLYVIANEISNIPNDVVNVEIVDGVKEIDSSAFSGCRSLSSITISDGVTSIGGSAFHGCDSLTSISIPNSVTSIGESAFEDCDSLTSVTIGDGVTEIGGSAFSGCDSLTSITIGDSVTSIGGSAFSNCDSLSSITIGDSVTSIGGSAFSNCDSLSSITIGDSVTSIGDYAFYDCSIRYASIPALAIRYIPKGDLQTVVITSGTSIGDNAFYGCYRLTSVTIGDSVTSIGERAFRFCDSLTSITIPDSVTSIGREAFLSCDSLTSITIGDGVTSIGYEAFYWCDSLTSVTIGDSVTSIGDEAFYNCDSLETVYYRGSEAEWNEIEIGSSNGNLLNAEIVFNYKGE